MFKALAYVLITLGMVMGTHHTPAKHHLTYRQQVVKGTYNYGPCKSVRKTKAGRVMYWDTVADSMDDGGRKPVKVQIAYVRQACRNGV